VFEPAGFRVQLNRGPIFRSRSGIAFDRDAVAKQKMSTQKSRAKVFGRSKTLEGSRDLYASGPSRSSFVAIPLIALPSARDSCRLRGL
jgi:hypothetical protein